MPKRPREEQPDRIRPLHGGRHSLPPDVVAFNQRERLLAALAATVAEHGYNKATIAQITNAASVSRRTFYEHFAGKEECFLAAFDAVNDYVVGEITKAVIAEPEWPDQVAAALELLVDFLVARPQLARVYLVESAAVGEGMTSRREATSERLSALLALGRSWRSGDRQPAEGIEDALSGGIMTLLGRRIIAGETERLKRFLPGLVEFSLTPYLGVEAAREVAARHI